MADQNAAEGGSDALVDISPVLMDDVMHRLHVMDYESNFCLQKDIPPFSRIHFAVPLHNAAVQFGHFTAICSWLLSKLGRPLTLDRYEDPASTINKLCSELKNVGMQLDFPPMKLRQAYGEHVCRVLLFLTDAVLASTGFSWRAPVYADRDAVEADVEEEVYEDEAEGVGNGGGNGNRGDGGGGGIEEEGQVGSRKGRRAGGDDDDEDMVPDGEDEDDDEALLSEARIVANASAIGVKAAQGGGSPYRSEQGGGRGKASGLDQGRPASVLHAEVDPSAWRAEVERVGPRLKGSSGAPAGSMSMARAGGLAGVGGTVGEWRSHLTSTAAAEDSISTTLPPALRTLDRLGGDLSDLIESVGGRERYINTAFRALAAEYSATASTLKQASEGMQAASARVADLSSQLAVVTDALEDVKGRLDEKGASMTDSSPLIKIKAALASLRTESASLDVQTGVVGHAVMQSRLQHKWGAGLGAGTTGVKLGEETDSDGEEAQALDF